METRSCGSFKGVRVQVAGLVATPGESWGRDQALWKLSRVEVQVAGFVTTPGGSWDGNQVLWKLQEIMVQVAGLVMYLEEVGVVTMSR